MRKYLILLISIAILSVFGAYIILTESYPVALVNYKSISAADFNRNYSASLFYYKNAAKVYNKGDNAVLDSGEVQQEIKRALLVNLIENTLIDEELRKENKQSELENVVDKKIAEAVGDKDIEKAAESLYGLSYEDFRKQILIPQAKKEIFEGRLFLRGDNFDKKMEELKSLAKVMIFLPEFEWNGKEVIIK